MTAPDFEGDRYPVTQSEPIPAPLTLAEVREMPEQEQVCWDDVNSLVATIEWLVERIDSDTTIWVESQLEAWLRGEV